MCFRDRLDLERVGRHAIQRVVNDYRVSHRARIQTQEAKTIVDANYFRKRHDQVTIIFPGKSRCSSRLWAKIEIESLQGWACFIAIRNKQRFANAIYFHLGRLDLYPDGIRR